MVTRRVILAIVAALLLAQACSSSDQSSTPSSERAVTTTSTPVTTTVPATTSTTAQQPTTSTTIQTTTTTTEAPACPQFDPTGRILQKLTQLKMYNYTIDGCSTIAFSDVIATFQKFNRLEVTGTMSAELASAILEAPALAIDAIGDEPTRVVVELERQLLFLYEGGTLTRIQHASTGAQDTPTPTGRFKIDQKYAQMHDGSEHPMYLQGADGVAIHGYATVPFTRAASHGCIRVPMQVIFWLFDRIRIGTPVYVV